MGATNPEEKKACVPRLNRLFAVAFVQSWSAASCCLSTAGLLPAAGLLLAAGLGRCAGLLLAAGLVLERFALRPSARFIFNMRFCTGWAIFLQQDQAGRKGIYIYIY